MKSYCSYCGSSDVEELSGPVYDGTHRCRFCLRAWIRMGPHQPVHKTYDELVKEIDAGTPYVEVV